MWTCYKGRCEAASTLLAHGANPNVKGEVRNKLQFVLLVRGRFNRTFGDGKGDLIGPDPNFLVNLFMQLGPILFWLLLC